MTINSAMKFNVPNTVRCGQYPDTFSPPTPDVKPIFRRLLPIQCYHSYAICMEDQQMMLAGRWQCKRTCKHRLPPGGRTPERLSGLRAGRPTVSRRRCLLG
jgi:hypothetical protein